MCGVRMPPRVYFKHRNFACIKAYACGEYVLFRVGVHLFYLSRTCVVSLSSMSNLQAELKALQDEVVAAGESSGKEVQQRDVC